MISLIIGFILGVIAIIFVLQNTAVVSLTFLSYHFQSSLALVIFLALAVGVILCAVVSIPEAIKNSMRLGKLHKETQNLRAEADTHAQRAAVAEDRANLLEQQLGSVTGQPVQRVN